MTTIYIVGSGTGSFTPTSTVSAAIECWGAGQAGQIAAAVSPGGNGAGYAKKNTLSLTSGTPIAFSLGVAGAAALAAGGDTWFSSSSTVIANGGGSATTRIGDITVAGGVGGAATVTYGGGGGAGGPGGTGAVGGAGSTTGANGSGGGGGNGGGTAGAAVSSNNGANGGAGFTGSAGGIGSTATAVAGGAGVNGSGGGGGFSTGAAATGGPGGPGGDDYTYGGGGGGGAGNSTVPGVTGGMGGTPGGGGGGGGIAGSGGWALIRITYTGTEPDQVIGPVPGSSVKPYLIEKNLLVDNTTGLITAGNIRTMSAALSGFPSVTYAVPSLTTDATHRGTRLRINMATPATVIIPPSLYDIDTIIQVCQVGAGRVTISGGNGVTLIGPGSFSTRVQYSTIVLQQDSTNVWVVYGDTA